jgi:hypothetical protein
MAPLGQTYNPKKMGELQKIIEKQTYPPIYAPKANHKLGQGTAISNDIGQLKSLSPSQGNKNFLTSFHTANTITNTANKPVSQPGSSANSSFNGVHPLKFNSQHETKPHVAPQYGVYPSHPFGRFS